MQDTENNVLHRLSRLDMAEPADPIAELERTVAGVGADAIHKILAERGQRYGDFTTHAAISQTLKASIRTRDGWENLSPDKKEALEMICHKIGRILNGDPEYQDSWDDIAGYAKLASDRCKP